VIAYAYSYVFFTSTVVFALADGTPNYEALTKVFGGWMTLHGLVMVLGGHRVRRRRSSGPRSCPAGLEPG